MESLKCRISKSVKRPKHSSMAAKPRIKKVREKQPASSIKTPKTEARVNKATQQISEAKTK